MSSHIDLQKACTAPFPVDEKKLLSWAKLALERFNKAAELTLRFVDIEEITELNHLYRQQNKPTNVLAFPSSIPDHIQLDINFLGDVIICPTVLELESQAQQKPLEAHWAHIIIHGILHLLGYDHIEEAQAKSMEAIEIQLLAELGFADPYHLEGNNVE